MDNEPQPSGRIPEGFPPEFHSKHFVAAYSNTLGCIMKTHRSDAERKYAYSERMYDLNDAFGEDHHLQPAHLLGYVRTTTNREAALPKSGQPAYIANVVYECITIRKIDGVDRIVFQFATPNIEDQDDIGRIFYVRPEDLLQLSIDTPEKYEGQNFREILLEHIANVRDILADHTLMPDTVKTQLRVICESITHTTRELSQNLDMSIDSAGFFKIETKTANPALRPTFYNQIGMEYQTREMAEGKFEGCFLPEEFLTPGAPVSFSGGMPTLVISDRENEVIYFIPIDSFQSCELIHPPNWDTSEQSMSGEEFE